MEIVGANRVVCRPMSDVTKLLENAAGGDTAVVNRLYELVYADLRAIAVRKMASECPGHTLQPTALVHEAYLRLGGAEGLRYGSRAHFFAAAAASSNAAATKSGWSCARPESPRRSRTRSSCW